MWYVHTVDCYMAVKSAGTRAWMKRKHYAE